MPAPIRSYRFPKSHRLHGRPAFAAVFDRRVRQTKGPLAAYAIPNNLKFCRLGISISRAVGSAPKRNRIKRFLRESFRLLQHDFLQGYDVVIVVRPHETLILAEYQKLLMGLLVKLHADWSNRPSV